MTRTDLIKDFAESIARFEGFYTTRSRAARHNNPGNLRSWGATPVVEGYALFQTEALGWRALKLQIAKNIDRGLTTEEFFGGKAKIYAGYAPAADRNHPRIYAAFVAKRVGISVDVPILTCYE